MNETEIRTFLTVIYSGSISSAAKILYLTQPALSRRIRILEEKLGYPLIVREQGGRTIELTEKGKQFVTYAEQMSKLFEDVHEFSNNNKISTLNIATPAILSDMFIYNAIKQFKAKLHEKSQAQHIVLHTRHSYDAAEDISRGTLDFAVVPRLRRTSKIAFVPIESIPYQLVTHKALSPEIKTFLPQDLSSSKEIRLPWDLGYESWHTYWFGEDSVPYIKVDRLSLVPIFLAEAHNWTLLPEPVAKELCLNPNFIIRDLKDAPTDLSLYLIAKKNSRNADLLSELAKCFSDSTSN